MTTKSIVASVLALAALVGAGYGLYSIGMRHGMSMSAPVERSPVVATAETGTDNVAAGEAATRRHIKEGLKAGDVDPTTGRKILFYYDPMVPGKDFDAPGRSPFMNMMLVPKYAGGD